MQIEDIKELVQGSDSATDTTRTEAGEMLVFAHLSQYDDEFSSSLQTEFRGQFDLIKPKRNRILSELWANPVSVAFKPEDGADADAAEVLEGLFRADMTNSDEAIETALQEQLDCGFGAFRFVTEYESRFDDMNNVQRIRAEPINEANNTVYWDDNSKRKDKSDSRWCLIITSYTPSGWKRYCKENGINYEANKEPSSFKSPEATNSWTMRTNTKTVDIGEFYHKTKKRKKVVMYEDPLGESKSFYMDEIKDVQEELDDGGYIQVGEKYKDRYVVKKYILTGEDIVKTSKIAGENIPVIPVYGDWAFVEGREIWRGIYYDAQDAQRLHNFQMSYIADIVAKGPREKPIFAPEQIQGFEWMYSLSGADNNYPYLLQNVKNTQGEALPLGPVGYMQNPTLPQASAGLLELTRQSVNDVTGGNVDMPAMMNSQVTEGQVQAAQAAQNMETFIYQNNYQLAMKQAGRVYASMAAEIKDIPHEVSIQNEDGSEKSIMLMESVLDMETGEETILRDISKGTFKVITSTGPNYTTQRDKTRTIMQDLAESQRGTEIGNMATLHYLMTLDGPQTSGLREYAREQLMIMGQIEPEDEEDQAKLDQIMQEQQANQQPDPNMVLAQAEQAKADASMLSAQVKQQGVQIDAYEAETSRIKAVSATGKDQAAIAKTASEIKGNELDAIQKMAQTFMSPPQRMQ